MRKELLFATKMNTKRAHVSEGSSDFVASQLNDASKLHDS